MRPLKKTYLVEIEPKDVYENVDGVIVINNVNKVKDGSWRGVISGYGTAWTEEELKDLLPIGTKVVMSYGKKTSDGGGIKIVMHGKVYYVRTTEEILGVIEE